MAGLRPPPGDSLTYLEVTPAELVRSMIDFHAALRIPGWRRKDDEFSNKVRLGVEVLWLDRTCDPHSCSRSFLLTGDEA